MGRVTSLHATTSAHYGCRKHKLDFNPRIKRRDGSNTLRWTGRPTWLEWLPSSVFLREIFHTKIRKKKSGRNSHTPHSLAIRGTKKKITDFFFNHAKKKCCFISKLSCHFEEGSLASVLRVGIWGRRPSHPTPIPRTQMDAVVLEERQDRKIGSHLSMKGSETHLCQQICVKPLKLHLHLGLPPMHWQRLNYSASFVQIKNIWQKAGGRLTLTESEKQQAINYLFKSAKDLVVLMLIIHSFDFRRNMFFWKAYQNKRGHMLNFVLANWCGVENMGQTKKSQNRVVESTHCWLLTWWSQVVWN